MRRGEIRVADLQPAQVSKAGSQADKRRPVVVVSNDAANRTAQSLGRVVVTLVPLTSNVSRVLPFQVLVGPSPGGLARPSKAQAEQVRSIAVERLGARLGRLAAAEVEALDRALRLHLDL